MPIAGPPASKLDASLAIVLLARDPDKVARCMAALLPALGENDTLLAGGAESGRAALQGLAIDRQIIWLDRDGAAAWNAAAELAPGADLLLIDEATEVGPHSLEQLLTVARSEPDAATLSALTNSGEFLSVPHRNLPWPLLPASEVPASAAEKVSHQALRIHPRTPAALPHLALVRRSALQLVGGFDESLDPREALADFCVRATQAGLLHVVADEVFVAHRGTAAQVDVGEWDGAAAERHPVLATAVHDAGTDRHSALGRSIIAASIALEPLRVTIDARSLGPEINGTVVHTVELIGALASRDDVRVRALVPDRPGAEAQAALLAMPAVELLGESDGMAGVPRDHVVHRPFQVQTPRDMANLDRFGERTIITNQDLIGYRNPAGFDSPEAWRAYRAQTREALGLAAMVLFFSRTARDDALAEDLVAAQRARVVPIGAVPDRLRFAGEPRRPEGLPGDRPFMLAIGNRFRHKNVEFALRVLGALRDEQGWDGELVIAGAEVLHGSGSGQDAAWLVRNPAHAAHVHQLGSVSEAEKAWLMRAAAAVIYPSTYEGFGLVPFEAAAAGTPTLVAHTSAMRETIPADLALLVPWDASASAARAAPVLADEAAAATLVEGLADAGSAFSWEATAAELVAAYRDAVHLPAPAAAKLAVNLADRDRPPAAPASLGARVAGALGRALTRRPRD